MAEKVTVTWRGREYEAIRKTGRAAEPEPGAVWHVTQDGAPVTSFPADPADGPLEVSEKIVRWLEGNETRPTEDIGRQ